MYKLVENIFRPAEIVPKLVVQKFFSTKYFQDMGKYESGVGTFLLGMRSHPKFNQSHKDYQEFLDSSNLLLGRVILDENLKWEGFLFVTAGITMKFSLIKDYSLFMQLEGNYELESESKRKVLEFSCIPNPESNFNIRKLRSQMAKNMADLPENLSYQNAETYVRNSNPTEGILSSFI